MLNIIITGANGFIAKHLINYLSSTKKYQLHLISTHPESFPPETLNESNIICYSIESFKEHLFSQHRMVDVDSIIHLAFARTRNGRDYATSLEYTEKVAKLATEIKPRLFINVSTQSIYGENQPAFWKESTPPAPNCRYAIAKYAAEIILHSNFVNSDIKWTSLRLPPICQNSGFILSFIKDVLSGNQIVTTNNNRYSYIDIRDAVSAIVSLITHSNDKFDVIYNVGDNILYGTYELALYVQKEGMDKYNLHSPISHTNFSEQIDYVMDSSTFRKKYGWLPKYNITDMVADTFYQEYSKIQSKYENN